MKEDFINSPIHHCSLCGKQIDLRSYDIKSDFVKFMLSHKLCFECAFWEYYSDYLANDPTIIDGACYLVSKNRSYLKPSHIFTKTREMITVDKVMIGKLPEKLKQQYHNNAIFVDLNTYLRLHDKVFLCYAKGCWDRYHCALYNMELERDGPWNEIPKNHTPGQENCESFIDKSNFE